MSTALLASHLRRQLASPGCHALTQRLGFATGGPLVALPCPAATPSLTPPPPTSPAGSKIKEIASTQDWDALLKEEARPIVVEFTAAWCPPCKAIAPVLEDLAGRHAGVAFVKIDIDNGAVTPVVADHGVSAVPTFVSLAGGKRVATFSGADRAQLKRMVEELSTA